MYYFRNTAVNTWVQQRPSVLLEVTFLPGKTDPDVNKYSMQDVNMWSVLQRNMHIGLGTVRAKGRQLLLRSEMGDQRRY